VRCVIPVFTVVSLYNLKLIQQLFINASIYKSHVLVPVQKFASTENKKVISVKNIDVALSIVNIFLMFSTLH
jgi:hypothetical protein